MPKEKEQKPEYFDFIKTDKTPRPHRVYTTLSDAEKEHLETRRILTGHKSNAAYLRQKIVYADLSDQILMMMEALYGVEPGSQRIDLDEGIKKLWDAVNSYIGNNNNKGENNV